MIAHLNGTVSGVSPDGAVIDVGGVGLRVQCTPDTLAALYAGIPVATLRRAALAVGGSPEGDAALDAAFAAAPYMLDDF